MSNKFEESVSLNDVSFGLASEDVPSIADMAEEMGGAWPKGWYRAEVIEGYSTRKGKVFTTEDNISQKGDSRNLRLCFRVTKGTDERQMQTSINYRTSDFTKERIAHVKEMREEYKGVKGRWADGDAQRSSLALARLGALEKTTKQSLKRTPEGGLVPHIFVGKKLDVYLGVDDQGYNEITGFAESGSKAK